MIQNERTGALSTLNNQAVLDNETVYCLQGNGIDRADTAGCNGKGWRENQSYTLNTIDRPAVYDARGNGDGKTVCTLTGDHQNRVTDYTALCIGNGQANQSVSDKAGALNTMHDQQAVVYGLERAAFNQGKNAKFGFSIEKEKIGTQTAKGPGAVCTSVVRRLTPMECERLQGYPDGWTDIGEWTDSKGKKHKEADAPRYKALGNSIAIPFWFWLLRRISAEYTRRATLGSLFDGIGGFPLCWEAVNGKGTARWASEIEEFPIAVTKKHFPE